MPLGLGQICSPSVSEDRPSVKCVCVCDGGGGGWLVFCCLGQHLFTHSSTVWDAKELRWMNQPQCLLCVSWLPVCGHGQDILQSNKTLRSRQTLADSTQTFFSCCRFVFPSIETNEMVGIFITLCEPPSHCTSRLPPYMKQSSDYCFEITNAVLHHMKQSKKK